MAFALALECMVSRAFMGRFGGRSGLVARSSVVRFWT